MTPGKCNNHVKLLNSMFKNLSKINTIHIDIENSLYFKATAFNSELSVNLKRLLKSQRSFNWIQWFYSSLQDTSRKQQRQVGNLNLKENNLNPILHVSTANKRRMKSLSKRRNIWSSFIKDSVTDTISPTLSSQQAQNLTPTLLARQK